MGTVADSPCDSLCGPYGLSVAHVARQFAAVGDGVRVVLALDPQGIVGPAEYYEGEDRAAASGAPSPQPSAALIDSQSVKTAAGGRSPRR